MNEFEQKLLQMLGNINDSLKDMDESLEELISCVRGDNR